jgi:hypothetical protein
MDVKLGYYNTEGNAMQPFKVVLYYFLAFNHPRLLFPGANIENASRIWYTNG